MRSIFTWWRRVKEESKRIYDEKGGGEEKEASSTRYISIFESLFLFNDRNDIRCCWSHCSVICAVFDNGQWDRIRPYQVLVRFHFSSRSYSCSSFVWSECILIMLRVVLECLWLDNFYGHRLYSWESDGVSHPFLFGPVAGAIAMFCYFYKCNMSWSFVYYFCVLIFRHVLQAIFATPSPF